MNRYVNSRASAAPAETLAGIAVFHGVAPEMVDALSRRCSWRRYGAGQTVLQRQDQTRDVFFVVRGKVSAVHHSALGREVRLGDLAAGDTFGEFAAIDGEPRSADIVSVTDSLIASMSASLFWDVLHRHPPVCAAILRRLTRVARASTQRVVEFSTLPVRGRLQAELLRLARIGAPGPDCASAVIAPAPTHAEIASRISTHREAVTRELNELARANLVERRGGTLVIRNVAALASLLEETLGEPCRDETGHARPKPTDDARQASA
jgi:CRP/FNR family transcriptional regulator, cyclic AMP receptor protein